MYYVALDSTLGMSYFFLWLPISIAFYAKYRSNPKQNGQMFSRIVFIQAIQLPAWYYASYKKRITVAAMEKKYLSDLSDYEVKNFDKLFTHMQGQ